jgi:hypothetical protein
VWSIIFNKFMILQHSYQEQNIIPRITTRRNTMQLLRDKVILRCFNVNDVRVD